MKEVDLDRRIKEMDKKIGTMMKDLNGKGKGALEDLELINEPLFTGKDRMELLSSRVKMPQFEQYGAPRILLIILRVLNL